MASALGSVAASLNIALYVLFLPHKLIELCFDVTIETTGRSSFRFVHTGTLGIILLLTPPDRDLFGQLIMVELRLWTGKPAIDEVGPYLTWILAAAENTRSRDNYRSSRGPFVGLKKISDPPMFTQQNWTRPSVTESGRNYRARYNR